MTNSSGTKLGARSAPEGRAPGKERVKQDSYRVEIRDSRLINGRIRASEFHDS